MQISCNPFRVNLMFVLCEINIHVLCKIRVNQHQRGGSRAAIPRNVSGQHFSSAVINVILGTNAIKEKIFLMQLKCSTKTSGRCATKFGVQLHLSNSILS